MTQSTDDSAALVARLQDAASQTATRQRRAPAASAANEKTALATAAALAEELSLGFHLGAALERIVIAATRGSSGTIELREAIWLIRRHATLLGHPALEHPRAQAAIAPAAAAPPTEQLEPVAVIAPPAEQPEPIAAVAPPAEPEPLPGPLLVPSPPAAAADAQPAEQVAVVHQTPSVKRELLMALLKAGITIAAITLLVLVLTLIAQWR